MTFNDLLKTDMEKVFCDHFAETITYYPFGGASLELQAQVLRDQPGPLEAEGGIPVIDFQITVPTSKVPTITKGKDEVDVAEIPGGTSIRALVTEIVTSDIAQWTINAQK